MKQTGRIRPVGRDFTDTWTRKETLSALSDALAAPAARMDVPLIRECLLTLQPGYEEVAGTRGAGVWRRIQEAIAPAEKTRMSNQRIAMVILVAALALALAAAAVGAAIQRGVFNFLWDSDMGRLDGNVQEEAQLLLREDLASLSLPHVEVKVREAVFDGHDLRLVYSVTEHGRTAPFAQEDMYKPVIDAGWMDGLTCCDWLEVDGETVYLNDTFQSIGEQPGEMLYYLQSNLKEWGLAEFGDTMTIGLPMMQREDGPGMYVHEALRFTIDSTVPQGMIRTAQRTEVTIGEVQFVLEYGEFSPVSGIVRIALLGDHAALERIAHMWGQAQMYDADGEPLCTTSLNHWAYDDKSCIRVEYTITPPAQWPQEMVLALPGRDGKADPACSIPVKL